MRRFQLARPATICLLASLAFAQTATPARAFAYGGYSLRASLDSWHDDNLARGVTLPSASLPNGNQDLGLQLGVSVGNVFVLSSELDSWLIVGLHGTDGVFYPNLGSAWASLITDTEWHLPDGREAYLLLGPSFFFNNGTFYSGEVGLVQPLWVGAVARVGVGGAFYAVDTANASYALPSLGIGLEQTLPSQTVLGLRYAPQMQIFSASNIVPRHQLFLSAVQPLGLGFEVHAYYLETFAFLAAAPYAEGYFDLGAGYNF